MLLEKPSIFQENTVKDCLGSLRPTGDLVPVGSIKKDEVAGGMEDENASETKLFPGVDVLEEAIFFAFVPSLSFGK